MARIAHNTFTFSWRIAYASSAGGGKIEQPVTSRAPFVVEALEQFVQARVAIGVAELGLMVKDALRECLPDGGINGAEPAELPDAFEQFGAKLLVGFRSPRKADD